MNATDATGDNEVVLNVPPADDEVEVTANKLGAGEDALGSPPRGTSADTVPARFKGRLFYQHNPTVTLMRTTPEENAQFQLVRYGLYALRHGHNNGLRFNRFRVPRENLLVPKQGDGLTIGYHGLNLGRVVVCAASAGIMRVMLAMIWRVSSG